MPMVNLKLEPKEAKEELLANAQPVPPKYPYGFTLCLDKETMAKLGIKDLPEIGQAFDLEGIGKVTAVHANADQKGSRYGFDLQITDLQIGKVGKSPAERIYGVVKETPFDAAPPEGMDNPNT